MTINENIAIWGSYDWLIQGEEWSADYGTSEAHWHWVMLPRLYSFLPTETILEIAPGYGHWTKHLLLNCKHLIGVDLTRRCVEACKIRFPDQEFYQNDGLSLECVLNGSVDFCFSYDSLVHCDELVLASYLEQLSKKLKPTGSVFFHHSNAGSCNRERVTASGTSRALDMTAEKFVAYCNCFGLACVAQELIDWSMNGELTDCYSIVKVGPPTVPHVITNPCHLYSAGVTSKEAHARWTVLYEKSIGAIK